MSYTRAILPTLSSLGTLFSGAGSALFGTKKILEYIYEGDENISNDVRIAAYSAVIASNIIIMTDTRVTTIFRNFFKDNSQQEEKAIPNAAPEIISINNDNQHDSVLDIPYSQLVERVEAAPEHKLVIPSRYSPAPPTHDEELSTTRRRAKLAIYATLAGCGISSTFFSALPSYLGAVTFFEFLAGGDPSQNDSFSYEKRLALTILMHLNAALATTGKFQANWKYNYPAIKKSAAGVSYWLVKNASDNPEEHRMADVKKYMVTLGLCSLNILSTPFLAYYSTSQTLKKMPYVQDHHTFIQTFTACSTMTAVTSTVLATAPAVRDSFEKWWYNHEEDCERISAVSVANLKSFFMLNLLIGIAGSLDSLATGANNCVSVVLTSDELLGINKYNLALIIFAAFCGLSACIVNAAFSVRRGHRAFIKNELYDLYSHLGYLTSASSAQNNLEEVLIPDNNDNVVITFPQRSDVTIEELSDSDSSTEELTINVIPPETNNDEHPVSTASSSARPIPKKKGSETDLSRSYASQTDSKHSLKFFSHPTLKLTVTPHQQSQAARDDVYGSFQL
ncbi:MAG: hypothetical protein P4M12_01940 [Gammaproteobacteria bacterium]|nr:hypothetical protein [Gammaproteobacteria bacterium]